MGNAKEFDYNRYFSDIEKAYNKRANKSPKGHNENLKPSDFKIQKGHTLDDYFKKYGKKVRRGKALVFKRNELWLMNKKTTYWEIANKTSFVYFAAPEKKKAPLFILLGLLVAGGVAGGVIAATKFKPAPDPTPDPEPDPDPDPIFPDPEPVQYYYVTVNNVANSGCTGVSDKKHPNGYKTGEIATVSFALDPDWVLPSTINTTDGDLKVVGGTPDVDSYTPNSNEKILKIKIGESDVTVTPNATYVAPPAATLAAPSIGLSIDPNSTKCTAVAPNKAFNTAQDYIDISEDPDDFVNARTATVELSTSTGYCLPDPTQSWTSYFSISSGDATIVSYKRETNDITKGHLEILMNDLDSVVLCKGIIDLSKTFSFRFNIVEDDGSGGIQEVTNGATATLDDNTQTEFPVETPVKINVKTKPGYMLLDDFASTPKNTYQCFEQNEQTGEATTDEVDVEYQTGACGYDVNEEALNSHCSGYLTLITPATNVVVNIKIQKDERAQTYCGVTVNQNNIGVSALTNSPYFCTIRLNKDIDANGYTAYAFSETITVTITFAEGYMMPGYLRNYSILETTSPNITIYGYAYGESQGLPTPGETAMESFYTDITPADSKNKVITFSFKAPSQPGITGTYITIGCVAKPIPPEEPAKCSVSFNLVHTKLIDSKIANGFNVNKDEETTIYFKEADEYSHLPATTDDWTKYIKIVPNAGTGESPVTGEGSITDYFYDETNGVYGIKFKAQSDITIGIAADYDYSTGTETTPDIDADEDDEEDVEDWVEENYPSDGKRYIAEGKRVKAYYDFSIAAKNGTSIQTLSANMYSITGNGFMQNIGEVFKHSDQGQNAPTMTKWTYLPGDPANANKWESMYNNATCHKPSTGSDPIPGTSIIDHVWPLGATLPLGEGGANITWFEHMFKNYTDLETKYVIDKTNKLLEVSYICPCAGEWASGTNRAKIVTRFNQDGRASYFKFEFIAGEGKELDPRYQGFMVIDYSEDLKEANPQ